MPAKGSTLAAVRSSIAATVKPARLRAATLRPLPEAKSKTTPSRLQAFDERTVSGWAAQWWARLVAKLAALAPSPSRKDENLLGEGDQLPASSCSTMRARHVTNDRSPRRPAHPLLLSERRYAGLHERSLAVPRPLRAVSEEEGSHRRRKPRLRRVASALQEEVFDPVCAARRYRLETLRRLRRDRREEYVRQEEQRHRALDFSHRRDGKITKVWPKVDVDEHADDVLAAFLERVHFVRTVVGSGPAIHGTGWRAQLRYLARTADAAVLLDIGSGALGKLHAHAPLSAPRRGLRHAHARRPLLRPGAAPPRVEVRHAHRAQRMPLWLPPGGATRCSRRCAAPSPPTRRRISSTRSSPCASTTPLKASP